MSFQQQIAVFNQMYSLPVADHPNFISVQRLLDFKKILAEELDEIDEIIDYSRTYEASDKVYQQAAEDGEPVQWINGEDMKIHILTKLADLLIDIQVYCGSEAAKWGIPMGAVQYIVMASNMSKLGADGQPIVDENGKVQKGPRYWKPEPLIAELLTRVESGNITPRLTLAQILVQTKQDELAAQG